jgi:ABC-type antimicrobial peptide transport system permease subunit
MIPYTTAQDLFQRSTVSVQLELKPGVDIQSFIHSFTAYLANRYHFSPNDAQAMRIWTHAQAYSYLSQLIYGLESFFILCGLMIFLACNISIANFMYYLTGIRKTEIGIKIALGAHNSMLKSQFLIEFFLCWIIANIVGLSTLLLLLTALKLIALPDWLGVPHVNYSLVIIGDLFILLFNTIAIYRPISKIVLINPKIILGAS